MCIDIITIGQLAVVFVSGCVIDYANKSMRMFWWKFLENPNMPSMHLLLIRVVSHHVQYYDMTCGSMDSVHVHENLICYLFNLY